MHCARQDGGQHQVPDGVLQWQDGDHHHGMVRPSSPIVLSHQNHPHVVIMPMFVKWDGDQPERDEKPAEEASSEVAPESNTEEADDTDVTSESQGKDETPAAEAETDETETVPAA
ncbi:MAG: hypothetical protein Q7J73_01120 [Dehalococcoidales bacterium]|nr:hypothetical protein [Dehalococcoidales bacterium]